ncbi:MAG: hypothetical protein ACYS8W_12145 [Planctomycetota bacterium]
MMKLSFPIELAIYLILLILVCIGFYFTLYPGSTSTSLGRLCFIVLGLVGIAAVMLCSTIFCYRALKMKEENHPYIEKFILYSGLFATAAIIIFPFGAIWGWWSNLPRIGNISINVDALWAIVRMVIIPVLYAVITVGLSVGVSDLLAILFPTLKDKTWVGRMAGCFLSIPVISVLTVLTVAGYGKISWTAILLLAGFAGAVLQLHKSRWRKANPDVPAKYVKEDIPRFLRWILLAALIWFLIYFPMKIFFEVLIKMFYGS